MESPQKKPATGSVFGSAGSGGFSFAQPQQNVAQTFDFGQPSSANAPSGGLFNRLSKPEATSAITQSTPNSLFSFAGQQAPQSTSSGIFGATIAASVPSQSSSFTFGQTSSSQPSIADTNNVSKPASASFSFGQQSTAQPNVPFGGSQFGHTGASLDATRGLQGGTTTPSKAIDITTTQNPPFKSLFGHSTASPQPIEKAELGDSTLKANPFAGLFGQSTSNAEPTKPPETPKPAFSFGQPSQGFGTTTPKAALSSDDEDVRPTPQTARSMATSLGSISSLPSGLPMGSPTPFSFGQTTHHSPDQNIRASTLFGNTPNTSNAEKDKTTPSHIETHETASTPKEMFGSFPTSGSDCDQNDQQQASRASSTPKNVFGLAASLQAANATQETPQWGGKLSNNNLQTPEASLANGNEKAVPSTAPPAISMGSAAQKAGSNGQNLFSTLNEPASSNSPSNDFAPALSVKTNAMPEAFTTSISVEKVPRDAPQRPGPVPKLKTRSNGPSTFNTNFTPQEFLENNKSYRLRSLDREFQQRIASLDFHLHDLAPLVRFYVEVRESIGESIGGLYARALAGTKRKADDPHGRHEQASGTAKRSRAGDLAISIENRDDMQLATCNDKTTSLMTAPPVSSSSTTSSLFQHMISTPEQDAAKVKSAISATAPAKSVFSQVMPQTAQKATSATQGSGNATASNMFSGNAVASNTSLVDSASSNLFSSMHSALAPGNGGKVDSQNSNQSSAFPSTTPTKSPPKRQLFSMPTFNADAATNSFAAFGAQAKADATKLQHTIHEKRKAEEYDSEEETEDQYEARAKKARLEDAQKIEAIPKTGFKPLFGSMSNSIEAPTAVKPSSGPFEISSDDEDYSDIEHGRNQEDGDYRQEEEDAEDSDDSSEEEDPDDTDPDAQRDGDESSEASQAIMDHAARQAASRNKGKSLFDRIEKPPTPPAQPSTADAGMDERNSVSASEQSRSRSHSPPIMQDAPNNSFRPFPFGSDINQSTPTPPKPSPFTPANGLGSSKGPAKLAKTFNYTPSTTPNIFPGSSVLHGAQPKAGPIPGEGLFGSRPSTPVPDEQPSSAPNIFDSLRQNSFTNTTGDNTWKQGTPIKFGTTGTKDDGPVVSITEATPPVNGGEKSLKPFGSLFGPNNVFGSASAPSPSGHLGFNFGAKPSLLSASSHLAPSVEESAVNSRASTPGLTDNESVATNDTEDIQDDPQTSLMDSRRGEEGEEVLFEGRSKACKYFTEKDAGGTTKKAKDFNGMGVGVLRVLKNQTTGRTRILLRAEPSSNIVLNTNAIKSMSYKAEGSTSGAIRFGLPNGGAIEKWMLKFKTRAKADELSAVLEENKT